MPYSDHDDSLIWRRESLMLLDAIVRALEDLRVGKPVVLVDDGAKGRIEGAIVVPAEHATTETLTFSIRHGSGFVCVALAESDADSLGLPPISDAHPDPHNTVYTVTVDARNGLTTGISARDRARTIRLLAAENTRPEDLSRPGHVVPVRCADGGALAHAGLAEAAFDLARMSGCNPVAMFCHLVSTQDPTRMASSQELQHFADVHGMPLLSISDLVEYRHRTETLVCRAASARVRLPAGNFTAHGYRISYDEREHIAFAFGDISVGHDVPVYVHAECLIGDTFRSLLCDCHLALNAALEASTSEGRGVVLYIRGNPHHAPTVHPPPPDDLCPGAPASRTALGILDWSIAAQILHDLGATSVRLMEESPVTLGDLLAERDIVLTERAMPG